MAPPSYADLGKSSRDLFSKGFNYGFFKLECKTKTSKGVSLTTSGSSNSESGKVNGSLETKYKWEEYGMTFSEKWNTDNILATEITVEDQIAKGLKVSFDTSFAPQTGKRSGKIKTGYKNDYINGGVDVDFEFAGPTVHGALVLGYMGWLAGYQMSFDTSKSKLSRSNFAVGYSAGDFTLHTNVNDGTEFCGSIYQHVNPKLDIGVNLSWTSNSNVTRFGLGGKYILDCDTSISAKINNSSQLGLGYSQKLRDGVVLTLSTLVEGKNFNAGGHKLGLGLELSA
ncbi:voltage-dependent anion-selective channel protein 2 [Octopus bimaculoides]|uniref:Voltage-dependent anion-selective channel protein 2 n=1 Tax=Octopus bimaculoides TaxID=37653 RepID=A0A0L8GG57_OCTBM|nr:voltage-dependent anion-selective channel protein 2 [Octopus bimaculoides]|eukprot:XP_014781329.1 PREDICTED: voltage-dependent anion-selective channel protein 2-like [Octopus bimaculoides]